ncbi:CrcB family protein [Neoroseomonas terrae]|jgi:CrcB protein|nr:CrcB family protein [Neoroseomonas terrae]
MVLVFLGGGLGAMAREAFMMLLARDSTAFPVDIFAANLLASLLLGLVTGLKRSDRASARAVLLIGTGFTGGMSTFSTFIFGAYSGMMEPSDFVLSIVYLFSSLVLGFIAMWVGLRVAMRPRTA